MTNRRRKATQVTPQIEDAGLFKSEVRNVPVQLVPVVTGNNRGDLVVKGIVSPGSEIEVVFAGRRKREAAGLIEQMKKLRAQGVRSAMNGDEAMSYPRNLRLPVQVRGTWRLRFERDASGWEVKSYQLLAAQWAFAGAEGDTVLSGWPPAGPENRLQDRSGAARSQLAAAKAAPTAPAGQVS
ncbi:hypothetical protein [Leisingera methylohalidivorans]|uniref:Uncharacterized protein n=1 Tax=Leisingera methylohalidivorans DSM 14336 TaxID=999552 RepID=V9VQX8_9RHOB|nr:hypothetical protein [Leisingera methylohalidivorans]AHC99729.1 hypothetical protein METH_02465 [Leisingera methylohalidivorans DSM 14336]